jgi:flagellar hook-associated protein 1
MGASALMAVGIKSMAAAYASLQTTSHNIANAHVKGYSRQTAQLSTSEGQFTGAGFFGKGVDVTTVRRAHSEFLTRESNAANSVAEMDNTRLAMLERLERLFQPGERGLGYSAGQFLNAMTDLASRPADSSTREVVLARAQEMASRFADTGRQLATLQRNITADIRSQVTELNQLAVNVAQANDRIAAVSGLGQPPNDLLDERDRLIAKINSIVQVSTVPAQDGTVSVFIGGGQRLVLAGEASAMAVLQDQDDPTRSAVGYVKDGLISTINPETLGGGSIVGLLRFQNGDLVDAQNLAGRIATAVAGAVNQQQQLGVNLYQPFGAVPTEAMFSVGAPRVVPNSANLTDVSGYFVGNVALTVVGPAALKASDYRLQADPGGAPGVYQLTRLDDGKVSSVVSGDVVDGVRIDILSPPAPGDRFLLQPVGQAAAGMKLLLTDVRDLAAASPMVATAVTTATGTVAIDALRMVSTPPYPDHSVNITFTDDLGNYQWTLLDASGAAVSTATGTWQAGSTIPTPPTDMNGFSLLLLGVPRLGDQVLVRPADSQNFVQNNGNAVALAALRDALIVDGATATDAYAAAMADVGVRVQGGRSTATITAAMAEQAEAARSGDAGVNLDEEAALLIQYQQAYQAAAKVLQAAQQVIDALLRNAAM